MAIFHTLDGTGGGGPCGVDLAAGGNHGPEVIVTARSTPSLTAADFVL